MDQSNFLRLGEAGKLSARAPAAKHKNLIQKTFQVKQRKSDDHLLDFSGFVIIVTSSRVGAVGQSALHSVERRRRKLTEFKSRKKSFYSLKREEHHLIRFSFFFILFTDHLILRGPDQEDL